MDQDDLPRSSQLTSLADEYRLSRHKAVSERRLLRRMRGFLAAYEHWARARDRTVTERLVASDPRAWVVMPWEGRALHRAAEACWYLDRLLVADPLAARVQPGASRLRHPPSFPAEAAEPEQERARARRVLSVLTTLHKGRAALEHLELWPRAPAEPPSPAPGWPEVQRRPDAMTVLRRGIALTRVETILQDGGSRWSFCRAWSECADALEVRCHDGATEATVSVALPAEGLFTPVTWSPDQAVPPGFEAVVDAVARRRFEELAAVARSPTGVLVTNSHERALVRLARGHDPDAPTISVELPVLAGPSPEALLEHRARLPPVFAEFRAALAEVMARDAGTDLAWAGTERALAAWIPRLRPALASSGLEDGAPMATRVLTLGRGDGPPLVSWEGD